MNATVALVAMLILGFWAIGLWTDRVFDDISEPFEIDEDF